MKINAEGGELVLQDELGNTVIIPKDKRTEVLDLIDKKQSIQHVLEKLPLMEQYAEDGSIIPPDKKVKIQGADGRVTEYSTNSPEYRDLYKKGVITRYDKANDTYVGQSLPEVSIGTSKPNYMKYQEEYEINTPKSDKVAKYLKSPLAVSLGNTPERYPKRLDFEYEQEKNKYTAGKIKDEAYKKTMLLNKLETSGNLSAPSFTSKEKEYLKKYNPEALRKDDYLATRQQTSVDKLYPTVNDKAQAFTSFLSLALPATKLGQLAGITNVGLEVAKPDRNAAEAILGLLPYGKTSVKGAKTFFHYADKAFDVTDLLPEDVKKEIQKQQQIADKNE